MAIKKSALGFKGRGLDALINPEAAGVNENEGENVVEIDINKIEPNRSQPRKHFDEEALEALAESIKEHGVIQPVILNKKDEFYELIAGERRWRASKIAGMKKIPAVIKNYDEKTTFEIALIENLQREDLNAIEEANGYKKLSDEFSLSQEEIAKKVGKSRSAVANAMRLLSLEQKVRELVVGGKISAGHARALLPVEDESIQFELAEKIIEEDLSVRKAEEMVKKYVSAKNNEATVKKEEKQKLSSCVFGKIETDLKSIFGTNVKLKGKQNKGKIEIEFYSDEDLDRLVTLMNRINN